MGILNKFKLFFQFLASYGLLATYLILCIVEDISPSFFQTNSDVSRIWSYLSPDSEWYVSVNWMICFWLICIGGINIKRALVKPKSIPASILRFLFSKYWRSFLLLITFNRLYRSRYLKVLFDEIVILVNTLKIPNIFDAPIVLSVIALFLGIMSYLFTLYCFDTVKLRINDFVKWLKKAPSGTKKLKSKIMQLYKKIIDFIGRHKVIQNTLISFFLTILVAILAQKIPLLGNMFFNNALALCALFLIILLLVWFVRTLNPSVRTKVELSVLVLTISSVFLSTLFWVLVFSGKFIAFYRQGASNVEGATDSLANFFNGDSWALILLGVSIVILIISSTFFVMALIIKVFHPALDATNPPLKDLYSNKFMRFADKVIDKLFSVCTATVFSLIGMLDAFASFLDGIAIVFEAEEADSDDARRIIMGHIYENVGGKISPVSEADIQVFQSATIGLKPHSKAVKSNKKGMFKLQAVPLNMDVLRISKTDFNSIEHQIEILVASGHSCEFEMTRRIPPTPPPSSSPPAP